MCISSWSEIGFIFCCCSVWRSLRYTSTQTTLNVISQYQRHRKQHMYWAGLLKNITIKSNHRIRHLFSEVLTVLSLPLLAYTQLHTTVLHTGKHKTPPLTSSSTVNLTVAEQSWWNIWKTDALLPGQKKLHYRANTTLADRPYSNTKPPWYQKCYKYYEILVLWQP